MILELFASGTPNRLLTLIVGLLGAVGLINFGRMIPQFLTGEFDLSRHNVPLRNTVAAGLATTAAASFFPILRVAEVQAQAHGTGLAEGLLRAALSTGPSLIGSLMAGDPIPLLSRLNVFLVVMVGTIASIEGWHLFRGRRANWGRLLQMVALFLGINAFFFAFVGIVSVVEQNAPGLAERAIRALLQH